MKFFPRNRHFLIFLFLWIIVFSGIRTLQHFSFGTNACDLSLFDYGMYYTLRGELMSDPFHQYGFGRWVRDGGELSFEPLKAKRWESHFSIHFTPLVFFFVPFYLVFDGPLFLLIFQVVGVGLSAFLLYLIAWSVFQDRTAPFIIAVSYLFFRQLLLGLMHDIHLEMYFPLFLFSSYYFIVVKKNPFLFSLSVALALFIKEDIAFLLLFYGIFLFFKLKEKKYGFAVAAGSLLYLAAAMGIAIPFFRKISGMEGAYVYGHFGGSLIQIAGNILSHPAALFENIYMGLFLSKLSNIILPLLLLPLMTSYALLILPPLLVAILSKNPQNYSFGIHYSATLLPFVFLSLIYGLKNIKFFLEKKFSSRAGKIVGFILILLLVANLANSPFWRIIRPSRYRALGDYGQVARAISQIPGRLHSVAALSAIIPHIPKRKGIFMLPEMGEAEYILIHSGINLWPYTREEFSNKSFVEFPAACRVG